MTTMQDTPTIDQLLREKRGPDGYKTVAAREIGVSRQIYDTWETGHHVPGDEWVEALAGYLGRSVPDMVWILYRSRINRVNPRYLKWGVGRLTYPTIQAAA